MKKALKNTMAFLLALVCAITCGTTAFAEEWELIPDDYVFSVPSSGSTFWAGSEAPAEPKRTSKSQEEISIREDTSDTFSSAEPAITLETAPAETPVEEPAPAEKPAYTPEQFAEVHLAEINRIREENGLSLLTTDPVLTEMAQKRVEEYRSGHKRPDGSRWSTIFGEYDTQLKAVGENWIGSWDNPYAQMELLMGSEGHKANILREKAVYVGIGVMEHEDGSGISVIQLYAK